MMVNGVFRCWIYTFLYLLFVQHQTRVDYRYFFYTFLLTCKFISLFKSIYLSIFLFPHFFPQLLYSSILDIQKTVQIIIQVYLFSFYRNYRCKYSSSTKLSQVASDTLVTQQRQWQKVLHHQPPVPPPLPSKSLLLLWFSAWPLKASKYVYLDPKQIAYKDISSFVFTVVKQIYIQEGGEYIKS